MGALDPTPPLEVVHTNKTNGVGHKNTAADENMEDPTPVDPPRGETGVTTTMGPIPLEPIFPSGRTALPGGFVLKQQRADKSHPRAKWTRH